MQNVDSTVAGWRPFGALIRSHANFDFSLRLKSSTRSQTFLCKVYVECPFKGMVDLSRDTRHPWAQAPTLNLYFRPLAGALVVL